jgi:NAD(P)-dependent dehydrogenase (short-subunit alcohol dehydrogenase family)
MNASLGLLNGRVGIVTGGGRGIGRGVALELGRQGCKVVIADVGCSLDGGGSDAGLGQAVADEVIANGGQALAIATDVTDEESVRKMVDTTQEHFDGADILVNNAGILRPNWAWDLPPTDFRDVLRVHVLGQFLCLHSVLPIMRENGYGRIVNMTSTGAFGYPLQAAYSAAKAAIIGLTYSTAIEVEGSGISINAFGPAGFTRMAARALGMSDEELNAVPQPIAPFVGFLVSEEAGYINGQVMMADTNMADASSGGRFFLMGMQERIATVERTDESMWEASGLGPAVSRAFTEKLAKPGGLPQAGMEAYVDKVTAAEGLPNYWRTPQK